MSLGPVLAVPEAIPLAIALWVSIAMGELGRPLLQHIYRRRGALVEMAVAGATEGRASRVRQAHLLGLVPTSVLGVMLVVLGLLLGTVLFRIAPLTHTDGRWVALPVLGVGIGQACSLSMRRRAWVWGAAALVIGVAVSFV